MVFANVRLRIKSNFSLRVAFIIFIATSFAYLCWPHRNVKRTKDRVIADGIHVNDDQLQLGVHTHRNTSNNNNCSNVAIHGLDGQVSCSSTVPNCPPDIYTVSVEYGRNMKNGLQNVNRLLQALRADVLLHLNLSKTLSNTTLVDKTSIICSDKSTADNNFKPVSDTFKQTKTAVPVRIETDFWTGKMPYAFKDTLGIRIKFVNNPNFQPTLVDSYYIEKLYIGSMTEKTCKLVKLQDNDGVPNTLNCTQLADALANLQPLSKDQEGIRTIGKHSDHTSHIFIISDGAFDDRRNGGIFSGDYFLAQEQCLMQRSLAPINNMVLFNFRAGLPYHREVFVVSQVFGYNYYHNIIEELSRIALYIDFLRANPSIKLHMDELNSTRYLLRLIGLSPERLISGKFRADVVYMPQGPGCAGRGSCALCVQALHDLYRPRPQNLHITPPHSAPAGLLAIPQQKYAAQYLDLGRHDLAQVGAAPPSAFPHQTPTARSIILMERSVMGNRYLSNHKEVDELIRSISSQFNLNYVVFSDYQMPSIERTVEIFRDTLLVVAPHGAGLANLIFSSSGTYVVEVWTRDDPAMTYRTLTYQLGQRWYGTASLTEGKVMKANLEDLSRAVRVFLTHWKNTTVAEDKNQKDDHSANFAPSAIRAVQDAAVLNRRRRAAHRDSGP